VIEKLQPCPEEKLWRHLWPRAVHREAFYYPIAVKPPGQSHRWTQERLLNTGVRAIPINRKSTNGSHSFFRSFEYGTKVVW